MADTDWGNILGGILGGGAGAAALTERLNKGGGMTGNPAQPAQYGPVTPEGRALLQQMQTELMNTKPSTLNFSPLGMQIPYYDPAMRQKSRMVAQNVPIGMTGGQPAEAGALDSLLPLLAGLDKSGLLNSLGGLAGKGFDWIKDLFGDGATNPFSGDFSDDVWNAIDNADYSGWDEVDNVFDWGEMPAGTPDDWWL